MKEKIVWQKSQRCVIDRSHIVTIDRVTPSGLAVVGTVKFDQWGRNRFSKFYSSRLEPLTDEIAADMALIDRGLAASAAAFKAIEIAEKWLRQRFNYYRRDTPEKIYVEMAERLASAISEAMKTP